MIQNEKKTRLKTTHFVEIALWSEKTADVYEMTPLLEIEPSGCWIKGDPIALMGTHIRQKKAYLYQESCWFYRLAERSDSDIQKDLDEIYQKFKPRAKAIKEIKQKYGMRATVCVVIYPKNGELPYLNFGMEFIEFMAEIGAELDFDICG